MIEANEIFSDFDNRIALWCEAIGDTTDLANLANYILENKIQMISVSPDIVGFMWTCLEKYNVKILTRYNFAPVHQNIDKDIDSLAKNIISMWTHGANGVQIFMGLQNFYKFTEILLPVRDDLFFEHDLCIGLDINNIGVYDWDCLFEKLRSIRAHALVLTLSEDMGNRSDFVGRVYGMLQKWNFDGQLHFMLSNDYERIDQVIRLIESEKPELSERVRFFLEY